MRVFMSISTPRKDAREVAARLKIVLHLVTPRTLKSWPSSAVQYNVQSFGIQNTGHPDLGYACVPSMLNIQSRCYHLLLYGQHTKSHWTIEVGCTDPVHFKVLCFPYALTLLQKEREKENHIMRKPYGLNHIRKSGQIGQVAYSSQIGLKRMGNNVLGGNNFKQASLLAKWLSVIPRAHHEQLCSPTRNVYHTHSISLCRWGRVQHVWRLHDWRGNLRRPTYLLLVLFIFCRDVLHLQALHWYLKDDRLQGTNFILLSPFHHLHEIRREPMNGKARSFAWIRYQLLSRSP